MSVSVLAATLAVVCGPITPAAHADSATITPPTELVLYDACVDYPMPYSITADPDTQWWIDVDVIDGRGDDLGGEYVNWTSPMQGVATLSMCNHDYEVGPVTVTGEYVNSDAIPHTRIPLPPTVVSMRHAHTESSARLRDRTIRRGRQAKVQASVRVEQPGGMLALQYGEVYAERKTTKGWRRVTSQLTTLNDRGNATVKVRIRRPGLHKLRIVAKGDDYWDGSRSAGVTVRVR